MNHADLNFIIRLPSVTNGSSYETEIDCGKLTSSRGELVNCRTMRPLLNAIFHMRKEMHNGTRHQLSRLYELLTEFRTTDNDNNTRNTRSLLPVVGTLLGSLFGISTDQQMEHMQKVMDHVKKVTLRAAAALDSSSGKISKIVEAQDSRIDHLAGILTHEANMTATLYREMNMVLVNFDLTIPIISTGMAHITDYIRSTQIASELIDGLDDLLKGRLSHDLIPREVLAAELKALENELNGSLYLCQTDPGFYYLHGDIKLFRVNSTLIVTLKVPLSMYKEKFDVIQIKTTVLPSYLPQASYMQMKLDQNTFGVNKRLNLYFPLDEGPIRSTAIDMTDRPFRVLDENTIKTCAQAILLDRTSIMHNLCDYQLHYNRKPPADLYRLDHRHIFVTGTETVNIRCPNSEEMTMPVTQVAAILDVSCDCDVRIANLMLHKLAHNCTSRQRLPKVLYNSNIVLLQSLFSEETIRQISAAELGDQPLNVQLPPLNVDEDIVHELNLDRQRSIELKHMTKSLTNSSRVYQHLSNFIMDKIIDSANQDDDSSFNFLSWRDWFIVISAIVIVGQFIAGLYLIMRLKSLSVLILAKATRADWPDDGRSTVTASSIWRVLRMTPRATPNVGMGDSRVPFMTAFNITYKDFVVSSNEHLSSGTLLLLIALATITIAVILLYRTIKQRRYANLTELYLEIKTRTDSVVLPWSSLRHAAAHYKIMRNSRSGPIKGCVRIKRRLCFSKLQLLTNIKFVEMETDLAYKLLKE